MGACKLSSRAGGLLRASRGTEGDASYRFLYERSSTSMDWIGVLQLCRSHVQASRAFFPCETCLSRSLTRRYCARAQEKLGLDYRPRTLSGCVVQLVIDHYQAPMCQDRIVFKHIDVIVGNTGKITVLHLK